MRDTSRVRGIFVRALAAGALDVRFDRPIYTYIDNSLSLPVGSPVPMSHGDDDSNRSAGIAARGCSMKSPTCDSIASSSSTRRRRSALPPQASST